MTQSEVNQKKDKRYVLTTGMESEDGTDDVTAGSSRDAAGRTAIDSVECRGE